MIPGVSLLRISLGGSSAIMISGSRRNESITARLVRSTALERSWRKWTALGILLSLTLHALGGWALLRCFILNERADANTTAQIALACPTLLSDEAPEHMQNVEEIEITAPDGLPLVSEMPQVAYDLEAPDVPAVIVGLAPRSEESPEFEHAANDFPSNAELFEVAPHTVGGGYVGRLTQEGRIDLLGTRGGTPESERAVASALAWLASHQRADGSWSFAHRSEQCGESCRHEGTSNSSTGATALALLPFLAAGQTSLTGEHRATVSRGLASLIALGKPGPHGLDLQHGTMYAQGFAALALCEAYALEHREELRIAAEEAIRYILYAQHVRGGWRYFPGQAGDATVTGAQFLALESARRSGIHSTDGACANAVRFLDTLRYHTGDTFGYREPAQDPTPTAIGWLCRMYEGEERTSQQLASGMMRLAEWGPSSHDPYFNFYTTQALSHYGGALWHEWNERLRDSLISSQEMNDHAAGSWYASDKHAFAGGRLYCTALNALTLEVYYRNLPLYRSKESD